MCVWQLLEETANAGENEFEEIGREKETVGLTEVLKLEWGGEEAFAQRSRWGLCAQAHSAILVNVKWEK